MQRHVGTRQLRRPAARRTTASIAAIAKKLGDNPGVPRDDVLVNLFAVAQENGSFGNGVAQDAQVKHSFARAETRSRHCFARMSGNVDADVGRRLSFSIQIVGASRISWRAPDRQRGARWGGND